MNNPQVITISYRDNCPQGYIEVNCTSRATDKWKGLSPFINRNITVYDGLVAKNMENLWQFSKVYKLHLDELGNIRKEFYSWQSNGFNSSFAYRYPMGKDVKPEFLLWTNGQRLSYVEARLKVYFPKYAESIINTSVFNDLMTLYKSGANIAIRDFDVYRFDLLGMSFEEVKVNPARKCGHGFVLYDMLGLSQKE